MQVHSRAKIILACTFVSLRSCLHVRVRTDRQTDDAHAGLCKVRRLAEGGRQLVACDKHIATIVEGQRADPVQLLLVLSNDLGRGRRFATLRLSSIQSNSFESAEEERAITAKCHPLRDVWLLTLCHQAHLHVFGKVPEQFRGKRLQADSAQCTIEDATAIERQGNAIGRNASIHGLVDVESSILCMCRWVLKTAAGLGQPVIHDTPRTVTLLPVELM